MSPVATVDEDEDDDAVGSLLALLNTWSPVKSFNVRMELVSTTVPFGS